LKEFQSSEQHMTNSNPSNRTLPGDTASATQFDVALSFSGADRFFAEELRKAMTEIGLSVFYDRDFESSLVGQELTETLEDLIDKYEKLDLGTLLYRKPSLELRDLFLQASYFGSAYSIQTSLVSGREVLVHPEVAFEAKLGVLWEGSPLDSLLDKERGWDDRMIATLNAPNDYFSWVDFTKSDLSPSRNARYNIGLIRQCMNAHWSEHRHGMVYVFGEVHLA
jgi:hypothetical protein